MWKRGGIYLGSCENECTMKIGKNGGVLLRVVCLYTIGGAFLLLSWMLAGDCVVRREKPDGLGELNYEPASIRDYFAHWTQNFTSLAGVVLLIVGTYIFMKPIWLTLFPNKSDFKRMLHRRRHWIALILAVLMVLAAWRVWPMVPIYSLSNLDVSHDYSQLAGLLPPEKEVQLALNGFSHPLIEIDELWLEVVFQPRKIIHGHAFSPKKIEGEMVNQIAAIMSEQSTYNEWLGEKACGGFHADYYLRWEAGDEVWEVLLCMGCHEVILFHGEKSLRCDLSQEAGKRLQEIIEDAEE